MSREHTDRNPRRTPVSRRFALGVIASFPLAVLLGGTQTVEARPAVDPPNIIPGLSDEKIEAGLKERFGIKEFASSVQGQLWTPERYALVESIFGSLPHQMFPTHAKLTLNLAGESGVFEDFGLQGPPTQIDVNHQLMDTDLSRAARVSLLRDALLILDPIDPKTYNAKGEPKNLLHADSPWIREALGIFGGKYGSAPAEVRNAAKNPNRSDDIRWYSEPINEAGFPGDARLMVDIAANSGRYPRELTATVAVLRMHLGSDKFLRAVAEIFPGKEEAIERFITGTVLQGQDYRNFQPVNS